MISIRNIRPIRLAGALGGFLVAMAILGVREDVGRFIMQMQTSIFWAFEGMRTIGLCVLQIVIGVLLMCGVHIRAIYWLILGGSFVAFVQIGFRINGGLAWNTGAETDGIVRRSILVGAGFDIVAISVVAILALALLRRR